MSPEDSGSPNLRLFVGIEIDDRVRESIAGVQKQLEGHVGRIRWVSPQNLHLTVKFLGSVHEAKLARVTDALARALCGRGRIQLNVAGLGVFPSLRRARILWAGLEGEGLEAIAERVETRLEPLGFARENRPFSPHLTLGRWRAPEKNPSRIAEVLERWKNYRFGSFSLTNVNLFRSLLRPTGPVYSVIESFELTGEQGFQRDPQE